MKKISKQQWVDILIVLMIIIMVSIMVVGYMKITTECVSARQYGLQCDTLKDKVKQRYDWLFP